MKDLEIREIILQFFYRQRNRGRVMPKPEDLSVTISMEEIFRIANQLAEQGLIDLTRAPKHGKIHSALGTINSDGVNAVEGISNGQQAKDFPNHQVINITGSASVIVGDNNTMTQTVGDLLKIIECSAGTTESKEEAKSLLRRFLEHPLVAASAGGAIGLLGGKAP